MRRGDAPRGRRPLLSKRTTDLLHGVVPWSYGFRSRLGWYVRDRRAHPEFLPWYPQERLFDPLASLDMCTPLERAWSARYAATEYSADGQIVELGAWLGGITLSLARALPDNPAWSASPKPVHVYDEFVHDRQQERVEGSPLEHDYVEGGSFQHHFERRVEECADRLILHVGDVTETRWTGGGIELLFNDVSKSWRIWNAVRATFYSSLVPGLSTVVEQDFAHSWTPWLHLWHYRARHHFRFIENVPGGGSVVFRLERELTPDLLSPDAFEDYDEAEVEAAYRWAEPLVGGYMRGNVAGAQVVVNMLHGELERATTVLARSLAAATPDVVRDSELLSDVVPALARSLEGRESSLGAPAPGPDPEVRSGTEEGPVPPVEEPDRDCRAVPPDPSQIERDLASWSGRPPLIATTTDGTITRIDASPSWSRWLEPDRWVGRSLDHIDTALGGRLPEGRWVGSVERDDGATELVVLQGTAASSRRIRLVLVPSAAAGGVQTVLIASPDLDPPG